MNNPGLRTFATATATRPPTHPIWGDINDDVDPDRRLDPDDEDSDYMPSANFGRWRTPGQTARVPTEVGPPFAPGEIPDDVIHGEVISPEEEAGADSILRGEHESDQPSANPDVEAARRDLHTPGSAVAVSTLSQLLSGAHPHSMSQDAMDAAHDWLSQRFTGVRVNPKHGTLVAVSPTGAQMARRRTHLPAVPGPIPAPQEPVYELTNKHGKFESTRPDRLVRALLAFTIMQHEIDRKKRDEDDGLTSTSGFLDKVKDVLHGKHNTRDSFYVPAEAVFEAGNGSDTNEHGVHGGYVMAAENAPADWYRNGHGTAYSPGHSMRLMLDPVEAARVRPDYLYPGHTFTYAPANGHTVPRMHGGIMYYVRDHVHPAVQGRGFDYPPRPATKAPRARKPVPKPVTGPPASPPLAVEPERPSYYDDLDPDVVSRYEDLMADPTPAPTAERPDWAGPTIDMPIYRRRTTSMARPNDLCPVCASGYLEPYDGEFHECLNCGSLVKHVGFEKESSRKPPRNRGGLGRGLADLTYEGDPLGIGSENTAEPVDLDETMAHHPLAGEELPEDADVYVAPRNRTAAFENADDIDEFMGKHGFQPIHKPGHPRAYLMPVDGRRGGGSYFRLSEGTPREDGQSPGWVLSADNIPPREWSNERGEPQMHVNVDRYVKDPKKPAGIRHGLPDLGDRMIGPKNILAAGSHPIEDDSLNRAIRDVAQHGRNSATFQNTFMDTAYEPPRPPNPAAPGMTQRKLRGLSTVNPGIGRFASAI